MSNRTRRLVVSLAMVGCAVAAPPPNTLAQSVAAPRIRGTAITPLRQALPGHLVRLRALDNGRLVKTVTTAVNGGYAFDAIDAGAYWIEVQDPAGRVISTDGPFVIGAGQTASTRSAGARRTFAADSIGTLREKQLLANSNPGPAAAVMNAAAADGIQTHIVGLARPLPSAPR